MVRSTGARRATQEARRVSGDTGGARELEVVRTCDDGLSRLSGRGNGAGCSGARARGTSNQGGDAVEVVWKVYEDGSQGARQSATEESATEEAAGREAGRAQADDRRAGPRARRAQEARPVLQRPDRSAQTRRRREPARAGGSADDGAGAGAGGHGACTRAARLVRVTRGRQEAADPEEINLCYDDSAQGGSARTFLGRTLDIFRGASTEAVAEVALTETQEDALRKIFNRVDVSGDGYVSVIEAIKALRCARSSTGIEADFARLLGLGDMTRIHQEDGTRDKLMLAFGALDADGDKKLSYEEFRRVVASAATQDPVLALDP